jgi:O-antigen/teichoic acid export membrane protein
MRQLSRGAVTAARAVGRSPRRRYALSSFVGQILFAGIALAGSVITARLFGPAGRGELTAWLLGATLGSLVLAGPIPIGMGRAFLARERVSLLVAPWGHAAAAGAVAAAAAVVAVGLGASPLTAFLILFVAIPTGVVVNDLLVVFQAAKRPWSYHALRIPSTAVPTVGLAVLWFATGSPSLTDAYVLIAAGSALSATLASVLVRLHLPRRLAETQNAPPLRDQLATLARLGRGSYSAVLLDAVLLRADQFLILIAGRAELGLYVVAVNCAEIGLYLGNAIGQAAFEDETTLDRAQARRVLARAAGGVAAVGTAVAAVGFLLIPTVFGDAFGDSRYALLLLTPGVVARTVAYTGGQIMLAQGRGAAASHVLAVTTAVALPLTAFAAWQFAVYGVAIASTLVYALQMVLVLRRFRWTPLHSPPG